MHSAIARKNTAMMRTSRPIHVCTDQKGRDARAVWWIGSLDRAWHRSGDWSWRWKRWV